jgi:hypothetical protein
LIPETEPDFTGKVVKIMVDSADGWRWWSLNEPRFERQHGRLFLVGGLTDPDPSKPFWGRNVRLSVGWDRISLFYTEAIVDRQQRKFGGPDCNTMSL